MPPSYNRIPPIERVPADMTEAVDFINQRIDEINAVLSEIAVAESVTRGQDGFQPAFSNDIDMGRKRVTNAERSKRPRDVVTRVELEELGLFTSEGVVVFGGEVVFAGGVSSTGGSGGNTLVTEYSVEALVDAALEGALPVAVPGEFLDQRTLGVNGTDQGTPMMGRDERSRADFVHVRNGQMVVNSPAINTLLLLILQELRRLNSVSDTGEPE